MARLRVLHVITHLALGGATKNVLTLCRLGASDRVDPALLCGATSPQETALEGAADSAGVALHTLPGLQRPIRPLADRRAYQALVTWLRDYAPDVVHTHGSKAGILGRLAAAKAGVPVIVHTVHGWGHHDRQHASIRHLYIAAERQAARVTDRLIVVADSSRDQGLADGIGTLDQYVTIRGGINIAAHRAVPVDRAALRASLGIPPATPVVGTVSRMAAQKAPGDFVRMAMAVHARHPDTHFVFVGGGPLQAAAEAQVRAAGLERVVHLLGYREDVAPLLRIMDIFVLNSLWEGMPAVFPQAMCAELPIVATDVGGASEVILDGRNGFLVPPRAPQALAERVLRLLNDPDLGTAMGQRGLEFVSPQFDEREMVRRIEDVYLECAHRKHVIPGPPVSSHNGALGAAQETSLI